MKNTHNLSTSNYFEVCYLQLLEVGLNCLCIIVALPTNEIPLSITFTTITAINMSYLRCLAIIRVLTYL